MNRRHQKKENLVTVIEIHHPGCWHHVLLQLQKTIAVFVAMVEAQGGGGGGTLKFSVYIGEADFFGVKILNFHIFFFFGFQKN